MANYINNKKTKIENAFYYVIAVGALILALILAISMLLYSIFPTYDPKYANYDSTGEEYDIYIPDYISVSKYKGLKFPNITYTVTEEDVDMKIKYAKGMYVDSIYDLERGAEYYDTLAINSVCTFTDNGENYSSLTFKEGSNGWGQAFVLGLNFFYTSEIDDAIVGMKAGETKTVTFTLPDPYYPDIMNSGREVEMEITLVYLDGLAYEQAEEVNEEGVDYFMEHFGYSEENYRAQAQSSLQSTYDEMIENYKLSLAYNYLMAHSNIKEIPQDIYEEQYEFTVDSARTTAKGKEMTLLEYVNSIGYETLDDYYAYVKEKTETEIKYNLICYYIIRCEGLTLSDEYYEDQVLELASSDYYSFTDVSEAENYLDSLYGLDYVKTEILKQYAIQWVVDNGKVVDDVNTIFDNNLGFVPSWKEN